MNEKFYVTTAIDYPNAEPHVGHAYQKIIADVFARWHKLNGFDVFFLTGTDEHGKKIQEAAKLAGKQPKEFVDCESKKFKEAWDILNIKPNRFIRTTDQDHEKLVQEILVKCNNNGDIYKDFYEGLYCTGCEAYYTEKDLIEGLCPFHKKPVDKIKEESYFFKLSKYQDFLLELYENNPEFILPDERRNEMINRVKEGLKDLSISRTGFDWGIPLPFDSKHVTYVWFDALFNYLTGSGKNKEFWPANLHLLGKDNGWFHTVYWPAFLKSAGYSLPETVFIHGFLTFNGQKISKSLGNTISPKTLVDKYGTDAIRYFVCRNFVFGEDGDFSEQALIERHNNELANKLGNLVSRISALAEKYGLEESAPLEINAVLSKVEKHFIRYEIDKALNEIFSFIDYCNEYTQKNKPWETKDPALLWQLSNAIKDIAILLSPFMPETSEKIAKTFNFNIELDELKKPLKITKVNKSKILFNKIEFNYKNENKMPQTPIMNQEIKNELINENQTSNKISYEEFSKVQLKVGRITKVEDHPQADKLIIMQVDLGEEKERTIVAGLKKHYKKEDLIGKKAIFVANLSPIKLRGIESNGMILAAVNEDESQVIFLQPEKDIKEGSKIR